DAHVEAGLDRVKQECRVDRLTHHVVAAKGERQVADAAADAYARAGDLQHADGFDEVHRVVVVFLESGGNSEDVQVEDDVEGIDAFPHEEPVGALTDFDLPPGCIGLPTLIERHHHHRGPAAG